MASVWEIACWTEGNYLLDWMDWLVGIYRLRAGSRYEITSIALIFPGSLFLRAYIYVAPPSPPARNGGTAACVHNPTAARSSR